MHDAIIPTRTVNVGQWGVVPPPRSAGSFDGMHLRHKRHTLYRRRYDRGGDLLAPLPHDLHEGDREGTKA
ncbi:hypothetical protein [Armatimonas sp.]|uniref:hypothetical protein n=1 Tax=Armatimonas sp. TaxID=1872638 RepID=UPI00374CFF3C